MNKIAIFATNFGIDKPNPFYNMFVTELSRYSPSDFMVVNKLEDAEVVFLFTPTESSYKPDLSLSERLKDKKIVLVNVSEGWSFYGKTEEFGRLLLSPPLNGIFLAFNTHHQKGNIYHTTSGIKTYDFNFPIMALDPIFPSIVTNHTVQDKHTFLNRTYDLSIICACFNVARKKMLGMVESWEGNTFTHNSMLKGRLPIGSVYKEQENSKICISVEGGSYKMARHHEITLNSIVAIHPYDYEYSYPWIDGENCIVLPYDNNTDQFESEGIERGGWYRYLGSPDVNLCRDKIRYYIDNGDELYSMYLNSIKTSERYRPDNYYRDYIGKAVIEYYGG